MQPGHPKKRIIRPEHRSPNGETQQAENHGGQWRQFLNVWLGIVALGQDFSQGFDTAFKHREFQPTRSLWQSGTDAISPGRCSRRARPAWP